VPAVEAAHELVGPGDHHLQSRQAFTNLLNALAGAGATFRDGFTRAMNDVLGAEAEPPPAATLVGVEALAFPEMLVEFEAIAVVD
jgi:enamine deaminase RidA (YjgF/YER057c/UK114 family)